MIALGLNLAQLDEPSRAPLLIATFFIFVLAIFLGFEVITKVPATLHTPLMSGSNAISGITVVGALVAFKTAPEGWLGPALGFLAIVFAMINVVGGFVVTDRMLQMFRKRR
ncbi:MAG: NAD(P) transhydrogenase subunit alpha [Phycisphaerales bacterium]